MLIAIAYCDKDVDQAIRLAEWMRELGPYPNHSLLVARDSSTQAKPFVDVGFANVEEIVITDDVWHSWPQSANNAFKKVATHIEYGVAQPWFWLEPDAVPMRKGWLDEIEAEYNSCGKPFLGDYVSVHTPELDVIDHMSGVAVYPGKMTNFAGEAKLAVELAWDVFAAHQIVPTMATSELIMHSWKHEPFADWEQVEREIFAFKPKCALFHADKSGSLYPLLRARMNLPVPVLADSPNSGSGPDQSASEAREKHPTERPVECVRDSRGGQNLSSAPVHNQKSGEATSTGAEAFTCDILIKSYPPDYELLSYCLRSIDKFASGFRRTILIIPKGTYAQLSEALSGIKFLDFVNPVEIEETGNDGYLMQQASKINAHEYTDADYILHIDSDTLLTAPVTPPSFFRENKPLWLMTPYSHFVQELNANPKLLSGVMAWKPITEKFLGEPVEFEFMRRAPQFVPRSLHVSADVFCRVKHHMSLTQYILSQTNREFSEFNALGALAYSRARDDFSWLDTTKEELPEVVAKQFWSHDPLTPERRAEFEAILAGGVAKLADASDLKSDGAIREGSNPSVPIRQTAAGIWIIDGDTHISAWVEEKGQLQHDYQTLPLILAEINEGDVVVDVGANIGDTTGPFLDKVGEKGSVIAFEPNESAFECLVLNCPRAITYNKALGFVEDETSMRFDSNIGASYLANGGRQYVHVMSLDFYRLDKCDFIKIDVEGYELKVLRGAEKTISRFKPKMAIEINEGALRRQGTDKHEIFRWLKDHDYQWWPLVTPNLEQDDPQFDILCRPISESQKPRARGEKLDEQPLVPWENKEKSLEHVRLLAAELKLFCSAPLNTARVRKELKLAKVIR